MSKKRARAECKHCGKLLSYVTLQQHKKFHLDPLDGRWRYAEGYVPQRHEEKNHEVAPPSERNEEQNHEEAPDYHVIDIQEVHDWYDDDDDDDDGAVKDAAPGAVEDGAPPSGQSEVDIRTAFYAVLSLWQSEFSISLNAMRALLFILYCFWTFWKVCKFEGALPLEPPYYGDAIGRAQKQLGANDGRDHNHTQEFPACIKCFKTYKWHECFVKGQKRAESGQTKNNFTIFTCTNTPWPGVKNPKNLHPGPKNFGQCDEPLGTIGPGGFKPHMFVTMPSIQGQLEKILLRTREQCDAWKTRTLPDDIMGDVFEGRVWKEWGEWFSTGEVLSLGFSLNCDWFQPYSYSQYSAGAVYMVILNLPREIRYRTENVILVGMLPKVNEHTNSTTAFTEPMVEELEKIKVGVQINGKRTRGALICVSCDLPAGRSLCGFASCGAIAGCPRCNVNIHKNLVSPARVAGYAGFFKAGKAALDGADLDGEELQRKTDAGHRENAEAWRQKPNNNQRKEHVKKNGSRWSPLLKLSYFDAVRFNVIDGMHCFFLGVVKTTIEIFIEKDFFTSARFADVVSRIGVPRGKMGRIMANYEDKIRKMTAEEYMTFALHLSDEVFTILLLHDPKETEKKFKEQAKKEEQEKKEDDLLKQGSETGNKIKQRKARAKAREKAPKDRAQKRKVLEKLPAAMIMWRHLSQALRGACAKIVPKKSIPVIQDHLLAYLDMFEGLFGLRACKPNHHNAQEFVKENLLDFGPMHVTWCFAYERLNGILGDQVHNFRDIERILPRRFMAMQLDPRSQHDFLRQPSFRYMWDNVRPKDVRGPRAMQINAQAIRNMPVSDLCQQLKDLGNVVENAGPDNLFWNPDFPAVLIENTNKTKAAAVHLASDLYEHLAKRLQEQVCTPKQVYMHSAQRICLFEDTIGSAHCPSHKTSFIFSKFKDENDVWNEFPGQVQKFYEIEFTDQEGGEHKKIMAYVKWFKAAEPEDREYFHFPKLAPPRSQQWGKDRPQLERAANTVYQRQFEIPTQYSWIAACEISASFVPCYFDEPREHLFYACRVALKIYL